MPQFPANLNPLPIVPAFWTDWSDGQHQRLLETWQALLGVDPNLTGVVVVVDFILGGQRFLVSHTAVTLTSSATGQKLQYVPGLSKRPELTSTSEVAASAAQARSVQLDLSPGVVDVNQLLSRGLPVAGVAEIALAVPGGNYDLRFVIMRGVVSNGASFGAPNEPISLQVTDMRSSVDALIPGITIDRNRWPLAQESALGKRLPIVINGYPSVPMLRVVDHYVLSGEVSYAICGHEIQRLDAQDLYSNGEPVVGSHPVTTVTDGLGSSVLVADYAIDQPTAGDNQAAHADVVLQDPLDALDVVDITQLLLARFTSLGDRGLNPDMFSRAKARMPAFYPKILINGSGTGTAKVMEVIENGLFASYPMLRLAYHGRGLGPFVIDRRLGPGGRGVRGDFTLGGYPLLNRKSAYTEAPRESCCTEYELRYGYKTQDRSYSGVVRRDASNNPLCRAMVDALAANQPMDPIESPYIFSAADAEYTLDWLVAHRTIPSYYVEVQALPAAWMMMELGDNILFTDPEMPVFTRAVATVLQLTEGVGLVTVGLRIWHPYWTSLDRVLI